MMADPMPNEKAPADSGKAEPGYIPKPPSQAELEQISEDQALITDEWAGPVQDPAQKPADPA